MKRAVGSGKATLPGPIQAFRGLNYDRLCLVPFTTQIDAQGQRSWTFHWDQLQAKEMEYPLVKQVWKETTPLVSLDASHWLNQARNLRKSQMEDLESKPRNSKSQMTSCTTRKVLLDDSLVEELRRMCT